jgi:hypothetical protein
LVAEDTPHEGGRFITEVSRLYNTILVQDICRQVVVKEKTKCKLGLLGAMARFLHTINFHPEYAQYSGVESAELYFSDECVGDFIIDFEQLDHAGNVEGCFALAYEFETVASDILKGSPVLDERQIKHLGAQRQKWH